ncbi:MAG: YihY/virulence factor BrkB family protein [Dysgonamonadaceae bacterium]
MSKKRKKKDDDALEEHGFFQKVNVKIKEGIHFLSYGIWRQNPENFSNSKNVFYNILKVIMLTVRGIQDEKLAANSRSLTYRTVLSIVPLLAVLFAIARGFGFENIVQSEIFRYFGNEPPKMELPVSQVPQLSTDTVIILEETSSGNQSLDIPGTIETVKSAVENGSMNSGDIINEIVGFVNNSLENAQGGWFAGIGVLLLLYTVVLLFADIENNLNRIWNVAKGRTMQRRVVDYFAMILIIPILMVANSGLSIMIASSAAMFSKFSAILNPLVTQLFNIVPYVLIIMVLTMLYKFMPNIKVKFWNALIGGTAAGIALQLFQLLYMSGQLWISKYNAIYGTFAAIPLLLLWLQLSWYIVLIGSQLSYASQNVRTFAFDKETKNISRRYRDYFTLMITSAIVKRFAQSESPLTPEQLSLRCKVPLRLTNDIISNLQEMKIISPTPSLGDERIMAYQPAIDINQLTVNTVMTYIDTFGSEDFMIDMENEFSDHWDALMESRTYMYDVSKNVLLKDL